MYDSVLIFEEIIMYAWFRLYGDVTFIGKKLQYLDLCSAGIAVKQKADFLVFSRTFFVFVISFEEQEKIS